MSKITVPARPMTQKRLRKLTPAFARTLLADYVETGIGYRSLSKKYAVSQPLITRLIQGHTYRDWNWPWFIELRRQAQVKAAERSAQVTNAVSVRIPDATKGNVEFDFNLESVTGAIQHLQSVLSMLAAHAKAAEETEAVVA